MGDFVLIKPFCREKSKSKRLAEILERGLSGQNAEVISTVEEFEGTDLTGKKLIFAISLGESGINVEYYDILKKIRLDRECLSGCVGGIIVDGSSELFTKSIARELTFSANRAGCAFPGKPLVEGTRELKNFNVLARNLSTENLEAYFICAEKMVHRVGEFVLPKKKRPRVLMLHASNENQSNTIMLWQMVKEQLAECDIEEISLREGEIMDCIGCPYKTCRHFGAKTACYYGGVITEKVYPAILACDVLILACPNYNDSVGANMMAMINRLTALVHSHKFFDRQVYALIVSGYSGGDIVAQQLISALNMNKTFLLPPRFALMETANDAGEIARSEDARANAQAFAQNMLKQIKM